MAQIKILQSNDDGWAVANIRALNTALNEAGFNVRICPSPLYHFFFAFLFYFFKAVFRVHI